MRAAVWLQDVSAGRDIHITVNATPPTGDDRRSLLILLRRVRQFWTEEVLERSLDGAAFAALRTVARPDMVENAWGQVIELPDNSTKALSAVDIESIFEARERLMLILGAPGGGKTTALITLARELVRRAEIDANEPVPVICNLSTWTDDGRPFREWLETELQEKYYVPRREACSFLRARRLLPLLDGLDEVRSEHRAACVSAINYFAEDVGVPGLVITSRLSEYAELPVRLRLRTAVALQPLTAQQVESHLTKMGERLSALQGLYRVDPVIRDLAQSPLMLNVMTLAYMGLPPERVTSDQTGTIAERRRRLWATYVERMLERKGESGRVYTAEQTRSWLGWLADGMNRHSQATFLLEGLQPSWLPSLPQVRRYAIVSRAVSAGAIGLAIGICLLLQATLTDFKEGRGFREVTSSMGAAAGVWLVATVMGLLTGARDARRFVRPGVPTTVSLGARPHPTLQRILTRYAAVVIVLGAVITLNANEKEPWEVVASLGVLLAAALWWYFRARSRPANRDIEMADSLRWSWVSAKDGALRAVTWTLPLTVFGFCFNMATDTRRAFIGLAADPIMWAVAGALFRGLVPGSVSTEGRPNQGVRLTTRTALLRATLVMMSVGGVFAVLMGLAQAYYPDPADDLSWIDGLVFTIGIGAMGWLLLMLRYGGLDVLKHYTLRALLVRDGYMPRNAPDFLDNASKLVLLRRVGAGYAPVHRELQNHLAELSGRHKSNAHSLGAAFTLVTQDVAPSSRGAEERTGISQHRHGYLTTYLILLITWNGVLAIFYAWALTFQHSSHTAEEVARALYIVLAPVWWFPALTTLSVLNVVFASALLSWRKWGFIGFCASNIVNAVLFVLLQQTEAALITLLFGSPLLYLLLQVGDESKAWVRLK